MIERVGELALVDGFDSLIAGSGVANGSAAPGGASAVIQAIVSPLPALWESSDEQNLLRKAVLSVVTKVIAVGSNDAVAALMGSVILPLLTVATNPARPEAIYLMEDGLELWQAVLRRAPVVGFPAELSALFPNIATTLEQDFDFLRPAMFIVEAYVLTGGADFVHAHGAALAALFARVAGNVKPKAAQYVAKALEAVLRKVPRDGAQLLLSAGVLSTLVSAGLKSAAGARDAEPDFAVVLHLTVLARVLLTAPDIFGALGVAFAAAQQPAASPLAARALLIQLVDLWLDKFDAVGYSSAGPWRRKLWALSLVSLLGSGAVEMSNASARLMGAAPHPHPDDELLSRLDQILNVCIDVLSELESDVGPTGSPCAAHYLPQRAASDDELAHPGGASADDGDGRQRDPFVALERTEMLSDVVHTTDLRAFLMTQMQQCASLVGPNRYQAALAAVEPAMLQHLNPSSRPPPSPPPK